MASGGPSWLHGPLPSNHLEEELGVLLGPSPDVHAVILHGALSVDGEAIPMDEVHPTQP